MHGALLSMRMPFDEDFPPVICIKTNFYQSEQKIVLKIQIYSIREIKKNENKERKKVQTKQKGTFKTKSDFPLLVETKRKEKKAYTYLLHNV